ncbi:ABC transporter ATP-binding protein [Halpernia frigidisoli]|uniref:Iron complex transport system ATP-binding protein n=1 Tax=Halpernia frigidisoli TaxID=1125876 RepID=A0A1I3DZQ8_9FLAO|nr:ABC transporter ATP-binding protein [Halpernia frigidisoli]SFH92222.1 iron complex transport system ATP-binding protein [Halpernia frigidisoli]
MNIDLKNITFGFSKPLISEGNMSLETGDVCLIIGDNGVGKTTLIKSILGQNKLMSGGVFLDENNLKNLASKEIAQKISIVFSKSQIPNHFTVLDLISFGKYIHYPYYFKLNKTDLQEVDEIIESLGLKEFENFQLQNLSDGNLQKAFIGRALSQNTPIIILDEPTTHLDEKNKLMILNLLRHIAKTQNKIILFSSHDWRLAKEFSDKICLLKNEQLFSGIAEDVLLKQPELTTPKLYNLHSEFLPPQIFAPELEKELLYSFLQKNHPKNLKNYKFTWSDNFWEISHNDNQQKATTFKEITNMLSK